MTTQGQDRSRLQGCGKGFRRAAACLRMLAACVHGYIHWYILYIGDGDKGHVPPHVLQTMMAAGRAVTVKW